ncbi:MAG: cupin domain-containing protein [Rickettsiales bacterium]|nr:cupin domain-containing protein [Rickettsiales bacterium]
MERTDTAAVIPLSCGWSDAGAWDSLWRIGEKDESGNVSIGTIYVEDVKNCYMRAVDGPPITALGVEDLVIVSTSDAVLVSKKDRAQDVKQLIEKISKQDDSLIDQHSVVNRPWGFYETIDLGNRHQVKHIQVKPGAKLSVQMHHHRAEHWVIVSGTARVQRDDEDMILTENQYVYIPLGSVHSIENVGRTLLNFVEVQCGAYLGEDDIVRFEDRYGRASKTA